MRRMNIRGQAGRMTSALPKSPFGWKAFSLTIVRHGETKLNAENIVQGHIDEPLNEKGLNQATLLGKYLKKDRPFTHVFSSDLTRARQTCENILKESQPDIIKDMKLDSDLRERFYGTGIDGVITVDDYFERFHKSCEQEPEKYGTPPDVRVFRPADDTERLEMIEKRQRRFLYKVLMNLPHDANSLVVTHGIFIKEFYRLLDEIKRIEAVNELERPFEFMPNTGRTKLFIRHGRKLVQGINASCLHRGIW